MHENLVIVESPAKAKTIEKFLGDQYVVKSSYGHIRDLSKKDLGIDVKNDFAPTYEISPDKVKVVAELSKLAKKAKTVWLASDEDREGEAIAWHLAEALDLPIDGTKRIVFHEITKSAITAAIDNPRNVDMNIVNAQQARRVLDRLVGFELSPVLWKKVKPSLSAGRVQSVTVRLVVEREREITNFNSEQFYRVSAQFYSADDSVKRLFKAELNRRFKTKDEADAFLKACGAATFTIRNNECKPVTKSPAAPFTTSTLQQEASRKFGMSVSQTMSVAQKLYEQGFITYMRTDSVNLSTQAVDAAKAEIIAKFGEKYSKTRQYKTKSKGAQEAHEAIRPTYFNNAEVEGTPTEKKLYQLIWKRTLASQMASAELDRRILTIDVSGEKEYFNATGEVVIFDGFLKLYSESVEDETNDEEQGLLPDVKVGSVLSYDQITAIQRFTQSPPRYSEASLVKRLEDLGIGRPSTYAPTITTVINRGYVIKQTKEGEPRNYEVLTLNSNGDIIAKSATEKTGAEKNKLNPTDIGMVVNDYLEGQFKDIMDYNFTAKVEKEFDDVADGKIAWNKMIENFYHPFHKTVEEAVEATAPRANQMRALGVDPKSGKEVIARIGRYGSMVQIGENTDDEKAKYAGLQTGQLISTITLEEALELFSLPRMLGEHEGKEVSVGLGRFGPYVKYDGKFTSLEKSDDPYTITLERANELVELKRQNAIKSILKSFDEEPELQVLAGRYGPYIACKGKNYKLPKGTEAAELTLEQCKEIMANTKTAPKKGRFSKKA